MQNKILLLSAIATTVYAVPQFGQADAGALAGAGADFDGADAFAGADASAMAGADGFGGMPYDIDGDGDIDMYDVDPFQFPDGGATDPYGGMPPYDLYEDDMYHGGIVGGFSSDNDMFADEDIPIEEIQMQQGMPPQQMQQMQSQQMPQRQQQMRKKGMPQQQQRVQQQQRIQQTQTRPQQRQQTIRQQSVGQTRPMQGMQGMQGMQHIVTNNNGQLHDMGSLNNGQRVWSSATKKDGQLALMLAMVLGLFALF